jgi:hypothetical protein
LKYGPPITHFWLNQQATLSGQNSADRAHKYDRPRILCSRYQFLHHLSRWMNGIDPEQKCCWVCRYQPGRDGKFQGAVDEMKEAAN